LELLEGDAFLLNVSVNVSLRRSHIDHFADVALDPDEVGSGRCRLSGDLVDYLLLLGGRHLGEAVVNFNAA